MRYSHDLSHVWWHSARQGLLTPIMVLPVLPNDVLQGTSEFLVRVNYPLTPIMHDVQIKVHTFYTPLRYVWHGGDDQEDTSFEGFITRGEDHYGAGTFPVGTVQYQLLQEFGQSGAGNASGGSPHTNSRFVNLLPFAVYDKIWNHWFRDEDLDSPIDALTYTGGVWAVPSVTANGLKRVKYPRLYSRTARDSIEEIGAARVELDAGSPTGFRVRDLKNAYADQRYREALAKHGERYEDILRHQWKVNLPESRLNEPEYMGMSKAYIGFTEVLRTDGTLGQLGGHGLTAFRHRWKRRRFPEHGYVMALLSIRPAWVNQQGMDRDYLVRDWSHFFRPSHMDLPPQEIWTGEVLGRAGVDERQVFGYVDMWDHYRSHPNKLAGFFQQSAGNPWHLGVQYTSMPSLLDHQEIKAQTTSPFSNTTYPYLIYASHGLKMKRMVPHRRK